MSSLKSLSLTCSFLRASKSPWPLDNHIHSGPLAGGIRGLFALFFAALVAKCVGFDSRSRVGEHQHHSAEAEDAAGLTCLLVPLVNPSWDTLNTYLRVCPVPGTV